MIALHWLDGLDDDGVAEVRALASAATGADGSAPLSDEVLRALRGGARHLLARADGGELAGFAHLADGPAELVVAPAHRRAGLGTRMARALLDEAGEGLRIWAHGEHPGAVALAARLGLVQVRALWQMHLDMPEAPAGRAFPDGVRLRTFVVGVDEAEFLRVNNAAFAWHPEQGGWGVEQVREREAEPWFDPAGFLLAEGADGRLLGYHWTKVHPGGGPGEVYVLGVDPAAHGTGLGSALTAAGLRHLHDRGLREVILYVESDNEAAIRVYSTLGFTLRHVDALYATATGS
ncbi:MAG: mycothiol synthase [Pseudonocardiales bacterium]|nr:mycothiol synthase [Pseudonocardiales bacterium]